MLNPEVCAGLIRITTTFQNMKTDFLKDINVLHITHVLL